MKPTMKIILAILAALALPAIAEELKVDIELADGRTIAAVEVIDVSPRGLKIKSTRGTQTLKFSDITEDAAMKMGAFNPADGAQGDAIPAARIMATPLGVTGGESKKEHKQRIETVIQQARRAANDRWQSVEREQRVTENRAQAFALEMFIVRAEAALKPAKR
jgi:hypothetical protein